MAKIVDMPKLSPTMEEGLLAAWHVKEGDTVKIDDLLAEVETDKATMEFRSFDQGTLLKILVPSGSQVKLGQPVAIVGAAGEDVTALLAKVGSVATTLAASAPVAAAPAPAPTAKPAPAAPALAVPAEMGARVAPGLVTRGQVLDRTSFEPERKANGASKSGGRVAASPYVRKAARERGIDLAGAVGSGPGGRVVARDLDALAARAPTAAPAAPVAATTTALALAKAPATPGLAEPEVHPLSMMRKTIARRLTEAKQTVPHFYLTIDVDVERFVAFRETINEELAASGTKDGDKPLKVSLNDLLIKACSVALSRVPECNATFTPDAILVHRRIDISVAVAVPDGLVTPVVRNADQKSLVAVAREVRELAARARAKKLKPEEMQDGTFSISNLGMFGIDVFSAVINPPEGAILAVGQVRDEPVVKNGAVVPGKRLGLTLSCDHRVVDGAVGAAFLAELRSLIEHPVRVLSG